MCPMNHQAAAIRASLWQERGQSMPLALDDPAINPTAQPASTRWVEFGIKMQKLYHAPGHTSPPALFFRLIFDANVRLWSEEYLEIVSPEIEAGKPDPEFFPYSELKIPGVQLTPGLCRDAPRT